MRGVSNHCFQSYSNIEVLLIDDCSPDNSVKMQKNMLKRITELKYNNIKIIEDWEELEITELRQQKDNIFFLLIVMIISTLIVSRSFLIKQKKMIYVY